MISTDHCPLRVTNRLQIPQQLGRWHIEPGQTIRAPLEFIEQFGGAMGVEIDFSGVGDLLRARDEEGRLAFDFRCPLSAVDGYGRHAIDIYHGLQRLGVSPHLQDIEWRDDLYLPNGLAAEARANARRMPCRIGLTMTVPYDSHLSDHQAVYRLGITQFETDRIPAYHVQQVNKLDHLIVTSHFQPSVWRRSGVRRDLPISVLTPGVDTDWFAFRERTPGPEFRVLILGALTARKDPITAVRAFQAASDGDESWRLTIKTRRADGIDILLRSLGFEFRTETRHPGPDVHHIPYPMRQPAPVDARITVELSDGAPARVLQLYHEHHCLLWPSKGEGVGLPPLEAMATGMEVVMSDNSGMADYAFPDHCWPVGTSGMERADIPGGFSRQYVETYGGVGSWWVPSYRDLVKQLRRAHDAWAKGRGKGVKAAHYVREHHTLAHQARSVLDVVEGYA